MRFEAGGLKPGWPRATLISTCLLAVAGCASATSGTADPAPRDEAVSSQRALEVLTGDELRATGIGNVYDALRRLRPLWLQARAGAASAVGPRGGAMAVVYLAGVPHGTLQSLRTMNVDQVRRVEFINARDATTRFGTGHTGGVIMVDLDRE
jgi:hypothetical protein